MNKNQELFDIVRILNRINILNQNGYNIQYDIIDNNDNVMVIKFYFKEEKDITVKFDLYILDAYNNSFWKLNNAISEYEWKLAEYNRREELYASAIRKLTKEELQTIKERI